MFQGFTNYLQQFLIKWIKLDWFIKWLSTTYPSKCLPDEATRSYRRWPPGRRSFVTPICDLPGGLVVGRSPKTRPWRVSQAQLIHPRISNPNLSIFFIISIIFYFFYFFGLYSGWMLHLQEQEMFPPRGFCYPISRRDSYVRQPIALTGWRPAHSQCVLIFFPI